MARRGQPAGPRPGEDGCRWRGGRLSATGAGDAAETGRTAAAHVHRILGLADSVKSRSLGSITLGRGWPRPSWRSRPSSGAATTTRPPGPRQAMPGQASGATIVRAEGRGSEEGRRGTPRRLRAAGRWWGPLAHATRPAAPRVRQTIPGAIPSPMSGRRALRPFIGRSADSIRCPPRRQIPRPAVSPGRPVPSAGPRDRSDALTTVLTVLIGFIVEPRRLPYLSLAQK